MPAPDYMRSSEVGHRCPFLFFQGIAESPFSHQEPGQGRFGSSRPASIRGSNFGIDFAAQNSQGYSQRSALFPWDNAGDGGASSSVTGFPLGGENGDIPVDRVEVRLRGSTASAKSRRASSLLLSRMGSVGGAPGSPLNEEEIIAEDFAFEGKWGGFVFILSD